MKQQQVFGLHAVEKLLKQAPQDIFSITFQKGLLNRRQQALYDQAKSLGVVCSLDSKTFFNQLDGTHQGVVALVAEQKKLSEKDLITLLDKEANSMFLFLDEVQDPHNLGAILRTADATGVDAVIIPKHQSVGLNETVRKVACGAAETVKLIVVSNLVRTIKDCQKAGMWFTGLAGETDKTIYETDFNGSVGIVMGAEGKGLRKLTKETCDQLAAIPMLGQVESLNVSVATGVTLYEVVRQRQKKHSGSH